MKKVLVIVLALIFILPGCSSNEESNETSSEISTENTEAVYREITAEQAKEMMDSGEEIIILDVRTDAEFEEAHIEGAILIPDYEIENLAESQLPDKNSTILIYCRSGRRSEGAALKLVEMGYTGIYDFGGIIDWPYETVSGK